MHKKLFSATTFIICTFSLYSFTKWDQRVLGVWYSEKLKSTMHLNTEKKFSLQINTQKNSFLITGKWRATQKYLYIEYFKLKTKNNVKVYYKTMIYRIIKANKNALILKHRYNNTVLNFTKKGN